MNNIAEDFLDVSDKKMRPKIRYWIPEGMLEENALRKEIRDISERGFGGIEVVSENFANKKVSEKFKWNSDYWIKMINVILDEAKKCNLTIDISNGLQWPVSSPTILDCNDQSTLYEITYGVTSIENYYSDKLEIPPKRVIREEGNDSLISVHAYRLIDKNVLEIESYIDLVPFIQNQQIIFDFSKLKGKWCVFAFWGQPSGQKVNNEYYVIDHLSEEGVSANAEYWEKSFLNRISKESTDCIEAIFCDSLEYEVAMEWTRDFLAIFSNRKGYDLRPYLAIIGTRDTYPNNDTPGYRFEDLRLTNSVNNDYFETLSYLYIERHLKPLSNMANKLGIKIRYQVSYNKPYSSETSACCVDIPENESLGRPSLDNLRTMAGATHLTRKEKYSFECMAEFMNSYGQTQEDIFWWIKRAYMAGINAQVFHGASYSGRFDGEGNVDGYIEGTVWPGYEAFGKMVSNYWNRTLSIKSMKNLLDTITRINKITMKKHKVDLVFLRDEYLNHGKGGDGAYIVKDNGLLNSYGYSYEFISSEMFNLPNFKVEDGVIDSRGVSYKALLIQTDSFISCQTLKELNKFAIEGLPIYFMGHKKPQPMYLSDIKVLSTHEKLFETLMANCNVYQVEDYEELVKRLKDKEILPDAYYIQKYDILNIHCFDKQNDYYVLYNYNKVKYNIDTNEFDKSTLYPGINKEENMQAKTVTVSFNTQGTPVLLDPITGNIYRVSYSRKLDRCEMELEFNEDQLIVIGFLNNIDEKVEKLPIKSLVSEHNKSIVLREWNLKIYELIQNSTNAKDFYESKYHFVSEIKHVNEITWWSEFDDRFKSIAGYGIYETTINLENDFDEVYLKIKEINDVCEIVINNNEVPFISQKNIEMDVKKYINKGINVIKIKVFSNLFNYVNKKEKYKYGINGDVKLIYLNKSEK